MRALLDVNVLVALLDENHTHNAARILSQPAYPNALSVADAVMRLRTAISEPYHRFLADSVSLLDDAVVDCRRVSRPRQLTDVYLLALAVEHGCRLVTFDTSILVAAVRRASRPSLVVI